MTRPILYLICFTLGFVGGWLIIDSPSVTVDDIKRELVNYYPPEE